MCFRTTDSLLVDHMKALKGIYYLFSQAVCSIIVIINSKCFQLFFVPYNEKQLEKLFVSRVSGLLFKIEAAYNDGCVFEAKTDAK